MTISWGPMFPGFTMPFPKMATLLVIVIVYSLIFSFGLFMNLLLLAGPLGRQGDALAFCGLRKISAQLQGEVDRREGWSEVVVGAQSYKCSEQE